MKIIPYAKQLYFITHKKIGNTTWSVHQEVDQSEKDIHTIAQYREARAKFKLIAEESFDKIRAETAKGKSAEQIKRIADK